MVTADLLKKYKGLCEVSFVKMASYDGMATTTEVKQLIGLNQNLEGRSVIIVEDIGRYRKHNRRIKSHFKRTQSKTF